MFDLQRIHHNGTAVSDIAAAQAMFGAGLGLDWAPVRCFDPLPFWTPERGRHDVIVHATYSRPGPHHLELVQGPAGSFFDPGLLPDARHIGVWVADVAGEAERLCGLGWRAVGAGSPPADGYGVICYMTPPAGGLLVELIADALEPDLNAWIAGDPNQSETE